MSENSLNPDIREILVGTRTLRKIVVYPISYGQKIQSTAFREIAGIIDAFVGGTLNTDNFDFASVLGFIDRHLDEIVELATDEKNVKNELSDSQLIELLGILYEHNFKAIEKKILSIMEKMGIKSELTELFRSFSKDIRDTISRISSPDQSVTEG